MKKYILILTVLALAICSVLTAQLKGKKALIMGTEATYPPYEYLGGKDGKQIVGFDVALAEAIAKKANLPLKIVDMDFDALIPAVNSGKIDFIVAGLVVTEERKKNIEFSDSYYDSRQVVIIRKDDKNITSAKSIDKKKVAVQLGTVGAKIAVNLGAEVVEFKSYVMAFMDLKNKKVDAIIMGEVPAKAFLSKNPTLKQSDIDLSYNNTELAIGVKKGNTELVKIINETLKELKASGEYDKLVEEYILNYNLK